MLSSEGRYAEAETAIRKSQSSIDRAVNSSRNAPRAEGRVSLHDSNLRFRHAINGRYVTLLAAVGRHVEAEAMARGGLQTAVTEDTRGATVGYWNVRIGQAKLAGRYALPELMESVCPYAQAGSSKARNGRSTQHVQAACAARRRMSEPSCVHRMLRATADEIAGSAFVPLLRSILHASPSAARALRRRSSSISRRLSAKESRKQEAQAVRSDGSPPQRKRGPGALLPRIFDLLSPRMSLQRRPDDGRRACISARVRPFLTSSQPRRCRTCESRARRACVHGPRPLRSGGCAVDHRQRRTLASAIPVAKLVRAEHDLPAPARRVHRDQSAFGEIRDAERELKRTRGGQGHRSRTGEARGAKVQGRARPC